MCREKVMFSVKPERMGAPCHLLPGATQSRASVKPRRGFVWLVPRSRFTGFTPFVTLDRSLPVSQPQFPYQ